MGLGQSPLPCMTWPELQAHLAPSGASLGIRSVQEIGGLVLLLRLPGRGHQGQVYWCHTGGPEQSLQEVAQLDPSDCPDHRPRLGGSLGAATVGRGLGAA